MPLTKLNNRSMSDITRAGLPAITTTDLPSGTVVQSGVYPALIARGQSLASATYGTYATIYVTPKSSNSRIIFITSWQNFLNTAGNHSTMFRILNNTSGNVLQAGTGNPSSPGGENDHDPYTNQVTDSRMQRGYGTRYDDPASTSQQTYFIQFKKTAASRANGEFSHNSSFNSSMHWYEVLL